MGFWKKSWYLSLMLGFILGSYKGYVALWDKGASEPRMIYPYQVTSLPPVDQEALEEGIYVRNETELAKLLEDFLS